jgi:hypothetical protein
MPTKTAPKKAAPTVLKVITLRTRAADDPDWRHEEWQITSFNINSGALALFYRGSLVRLYSPGTWADVRVTEERPIES